MMTSQCAFCPKVDGRMYICPRCNSTYCGIGCYKSKDHIGCSESFSRDWVNETIASEGKERVVKPNPIIEALHDQLAEDDFDVDSGDDLPDDPSFEDFQVENPDSPQLNASFIESLTESDLNEQLRALGLDPDDDVALLDALDDEQKQAFTRLIANCGDEVERSSNVKEKRGKGDVFEGKMVNKAAENQASGEKSDSQFSAGTAVESEEACGSKKLIAERNGDEQHSENGYDEKLWYERLSGVRFADDPIDFLPDVGCFKNLPSLPENFKVSDSVVPNLVNILSVYIIGLISNDGNLAEFAIERSKSLSCHQEYESSTWAALEPVFKASADKSLILRGLMTLLSKKESGLPFWVFALADLKTKFLARKKWTKFAKRLDFFVLANGCKPFNLEPVVKELWLESKLSC